VIGRIRSGRVANLDSLTVAHLRVLSKAAR